jgi:hypothetical protein
VFDREGVKDEIGTLNLLTPDVVQNAAKEVRTGMSVSLNWGLEKIHQPGFGRTKLQHKFLNWREKEGFSFYSYDDEITVNTQAGMGIHANERQSELTRSRQPMGWTS